MKRHEVSQMESLHSVWRHPTTTPNDNCWVDFFLSKHQESDVSEKSPREIMARVGVEEVGAKVSCRLKMEIKLRSRMAKVKFSPLLAFTQNGMNKVFFSLYIRITYRPSGWFNLNFDIFYIAKRQFHFDSFMIQATNNLCHTGWEPIDGPIALPLSRCFNNSHCM